MICIQFLFVETFFHTSFLSYIYLTLQVLMLQRLGMLELVLLVSQVKPF